LKWQAPSSPAFVGCSIYLTSQTITAGTYAILTFANENFDTDSFHSTVSNTSRITIPSGKGGKYLVVGTIRYETNTSAATVLYKNGSRVTGTGLTEGWIQTVINTAGNTANGISATHLISLAAGDYIELAYYTDGSGTKTVSTGQFDAIYLGA
jgi:hypothetical protein